MTIIKDFFSVVDEIKKDYDRLERLEYMADMLIAIEEHDGHEIYTGSLMSDTFVSHVMSAIGRAKRHRKLGEELE